MSRQHCSFVGASALSLSLSQWTIDRNTSETFKRKLFSYRERIIPLRLSFRALRNWSQQACMDESASARAGAHAYTLCAPYRCEGWAHSASRTRLRIVRHK